MKRRLPSASGSRPPASLHVIRKGGQRFRIGPWRGLPERVQAALLHQPLERIEALAEHAHRRVVVQRLQARRAVDRHHAARVAQQRRQVQIVHVVQTTGKT